MFRFGQRNSPSWNKGLKSPTKDRKLPPEPLSDEELHRIFTHLDELHSKSSYRTTAFIVMCLRGLLRCREALEVYPKDMNLDEGIIRILHGKGDKCRVIGIDKKACLRIREWMDIRAEMGIGPDSPVICWVDKDRLGAPLTTSWARKTLKNLRIACGIHRRVHCHGFRHSGAVQLLREGAPLNVISKQLGHSNLTMTERYLNHIHPGTVINYMQNRVWHDHQWSAVPTDQKYIVLRESKGSVGFVVTLNTEFGDRADRYLKFPSEIVKKLEEATFFESREGANCAVEQLLPQIDLRHYTPSVQPVCKGK